jgi:hypothetical protein
MGGKFRVKVASGGGRSEAPPSCAGTTAESINRRIFMISRSVPVGLKLFLLGRLVAKPDNEPT